MAFALFRGLSASSNPAPPHWRYRCAATCARSGRSTALPTCTRTSKPTTRGFAAILATGLDGQSAEDILAVPDDFYTDLGLAKLISPLRLRGMSAMLARIKNRLK